MNVALVCDWFHPRIGGIELHVHDLATHLMAAGHEVVVVTSTPGPDMAGDVRVRRIDAPRAPRFGFLITPSGVRAIGDALAAERVDVAHCHVSIVSPAGFGGARVAQRLGIPTVVTFHSVVPNMRLLASGAACVFRTARWSACFSAVSERVARDVRALAGDRPMSILSNGIDVDFWRPVHQRTTSGTIELISVMRLNPKKRPMTLIQMMPRLRALLPYDARVRLRIVGDGPLRRQVERAAAEQQLDDRVELLGHRTRGEIRDLLWDSDVFVLPTVRESFGLAALEARCAGVPVVAMRASGVAEFIQDDQEGLLAATDGELATHVAALATGVERRRRIASHNCQTVPRYDWSTVIGAHMALYGEATALARRDKVRLDSTT